MVLSVGERCAAGAVVSAFSTCTTDGYAGGFDEVTRSGRRRHSAVTQEIDAVLPPSRRVPAHRWAPTAPTVPVSLYRVSPAA
ncbi:hypothetical protein GCM10018772_19650 [Streptomyces fumanus]|uniref:Uncharacterized protein n=1 Tax=Streptomyces fumanus TaxID=67302 RepID=A0A919AA93_9ACTN|nr:hypothetical protein GCM10018772_19650 [Streptomyces fumanus]